MTPMFQVVMRDTDKSREQVRQISKEGRSLPSFLEGGGETAALIAARDWSSLSIGPLLAWPQSLKTTLSIVLHSPIPMVLLWGADGIMLYNDSYSVFAGGRHPKLLGSKVREGWPEVADFNDNVMRTGLAGKTLAYRDQELTLYRKGVAEQVWMNLDYSPVYDESGHPAGVLAIVVETTERVLAERHMAVEHQRLIDMCEQAPGMMAMFEGPKHKYILANAAHRRLVGKEELIGRSVSEVHPELVPQGIVDRLDEVFKSGTPYRADGVPVRLQHPAERAMEERILNVIYQPVRDSAGKVTGIFFEGFDVTDGQREIDRRTRAEAALSDRERELQLLTDAMPVLIAYIDASLHFRFVNRVYESWFARPRSEIQGKLVEEILGPNLFVKVKAHVDRALAGEAVAFDQEMAYPGGMRHIHAEYLPRFDTDTGAVIGIYTLVQDFTELRKSERQVRLLMREVNHRSKNLLAVVQSIARQTSRTGSSRTFADRFADRLQGLSASHNLLVNNSWTGVDLGELVHSQLSHLLDDVEKQVRITGPKVWIGPRVAQAIGMAIHELVTNSLKYGALSVERGRVEVVWTLDGPAPESSFIMSWIENEGPPVRKQPSRRGFGTLLLSTMTESTVGGRVTLDYRETGLRWTLQAPASMVVFDTDHSADIVFSEK